MQKYLNYLYSKNIISILQREYFRNICIFNSLEKYSGICYFPRKKSFIIFISAYKMHLYNGQILYTEVIYFIHSNNIYDLTLIKKYIKIIYIL